MRPVAVAAKGCICVAAQQRLAVRTAVVDILRFFVTCGARNCSQLLRVRQFGDARVALRTRESLVNGYIHRIGNHP